METTARRAIWTTAAGGLLLWAITRLLEHVEVGTLLSVVGIANLVVFVTAGGYLVYWNSPRVRKRREFKALAPDLEEAAIQMAGGVSAEVKGGGGGDRNKPYESCAILLNQLRDEYEILVPHDPNGVVLGQLLFREDDTTFERLVAYARAGNLEAARQINWPDWPPESA